MATKIIIGLVAGVTLLFAAIFGIYQLLRRYSLKRGLSPQVKARCPECGAEFEKPLAEMSAMTKGVEAHAGGGIPGHSFMKVYRKDQKKRCTCPHCGKTVWAEIDPESYRYLRMNW